MIIKTIVLLKNIVPLTFIDMSYLNKFTLMVRLRIKFLVKVNVFHVLKIVQCRITLPITEVKTLFLCNIVPAWQMMVHECRFKNAPVCSCSDKNNALKILHS